MFKPSKKKGSGRSKEKASFKLDFHVAKIPQRGWDKLQISLISVETGKATAKTGKVPVRNGTCQWPESLYESVNVPADSSGEDMDKELYKLVVSMGLSRFGILGEAMINFAEYHQAIDAPMSLTLPLQNCSSGSILHVKIQRIMSKSSNRHLQEPKVSAMEQDPQLCDQQIRLDSDDGGVHEGIGHAKMPKSVAEDELVAPRYSSDSVDIPSTPALSEARGPQEDLMSPSSSVSSCSGRHEQVTGFHDYAGFKNNEFLSPSVIAKPQTQTTLSHLASNSPEHGNGVQSPLWASTESTNRMSQDDELKSQESSSLGSSIHGELAKSIIKEDVFSQEQHNKDFVVEIQVLKQHLEEERLWNKELHSKMAALVIERDSILQEMSALQGQVNTTMKNMQDELDCEKTPNLNLNLQLQKAMDSNFELLAEIQDLKRQLEDKRQTENQAEFENIEKIEGLRQEISSLKKEMEELEQDTQELTEENLDLISQLKQANDKLKSQELNNDNVKNVAVWENEKLHLVEKLRIMEESFEGKLNSSRTVIDDLNSSVLMLRSKNAHIERQLQSSQQCVSELTSDVERMRSEIEGHEKEKSLLASQRGQLKGLREKALKTEQDYAMALKCLDELQALNVELNEEKDQISKTKELQLERLKQESLALQVKYNGDLDVIQSLQLEKSELEKEIALLRVGKEDGESNIMMLQKQTATLQEKLCQEELKILSFLHDSQCYEAKTSQILQDLNASRSQVKNLEQSIRDLEGEREIMRTETFHLRQEHDLLKAQVKHLEADCHDLAASKSELTEKLKNAREDIEWTRENTSILVNEIRGLESEIESGQALQRRLEQLLQEQEAQKAALSSEVERLLTENSLWKKELDEKEALLARLQNKKNAYKEFDFNIRDSSEELHVERRDAITRENELLKQENIKCTQKLLEMEAKCAVLEHEKGVMNSQLSEADERARLHDEAASQWKQVKDGLEEKISQLQDAAANELARWPIEEKSNDLNKLKKQTSELKQKLCKQEVEREELNKKVVSLEEELLDKANALAFAEKKLKEKDTSSNNGGTVNLIGRSLSRINSKVGPISATTAVRDAKELTHLREKVKFLELEVKRKATELDASKNQLKEQQIQLLSRIEDLEVTNEQLMEERALLSIDSVTKEVNNSLRSQNAILLDREHELLSKLVSQEALQSELECLKKQLESALSKQEAAANCESLMRRVVALETELAEVMEANNMYKSQLQSAFSKPQNVHAAAIENMGSMDQVLKDLAELKKRNLVLDDELRDMRDRYFNMSLQFAEVEAEREELVMVIRNLRGSKKLMPNWSVNF